MNKIGDISVFFSTFSGTVDNTTSEASAGFKSSWESIKIFDFEQKARKCYQKMISKVTFTSSDSSQFSRKVFKNWFRNPNHPFCQKKKNYLLDNVIPVSLFCF